MSDFMDTQHLTSFHRKTLNWVLLSIFSKIKLRLPGMKNIFYYHNVFFVINLLPLCAKFLFISFGRFYFKSLQPLTWKMSHAFFKIVSLHFDFKWLWLHDCKFFFTACSKKWRVKKDEHDKFQSKLIRNSS